MNTREDVMLCQTASLLQFSGGGTQYTVQTPAGVYYMVYVDTGSDISFRKSDDGGFTWSTPTVISGAITATALSIWYDRWSNIAAGKIHVAFIESALDDVSYVSIDTENSDAVSAITIPFAGASTAAGGCLSITRARGGNIGVAYMIDAGAELGFNISVDGGATWVGTRTSCMEATTDQIILLPGWAADTNDMMAFFWDQSASEISRKLFDDSANSWAESSIATSMTATAASGSFPHFAAAVDITNSRNLLVAWSIVDSNGADLRCWYITESAITETTNVVLNSSDDQGLAAIGIDADNYWWVFYAGESGGSETWHSAIKLYYKISKDSGSTWGPETSLTPNAKNTAWLICTPRFTGQPVAAWHNDLTLDELMVNVSTNSARATYIAGVM